jgi:membrane protease YdiL (CAAX protease family)
MKTKKTEMTALFIIVFLAGILYLTGMPFCLLNISVQNKDIPFVNILYIANTFFLSIIIIGTVKKILKGWVYGLTSKHLIKNLIDNGKMFLLGAFSVLLLSIYIYTPLNRLPTAGEIVLWVLLSNFSIAIIEEILLRALLLKAFENIFSKNIIVAVIVTSAIFGIAHIPGMINENILVIMIRVLGTTAVGITLSLIYIKTRNLWTVIILHFILNCFGSIIYYFSNSNDVYAIAKIWPVPMIIVCLINLKTMKLFNTSSLRMY